MTALQSIIKEAKSLRTKFPKRFHKWTDYVKQASAIYAAKNKSKSLVGKKKIVKKKAAKKSIAKKPTEKVILKKVHSAKATSKKLFNKLDNLDEAQHKHMAGYIRTIKKNNITNVIYSNNIKQPKKKIKQGQLFGIGKIIGELFDKTIIKDIDTLKKQYFQLAKKYHPDSGGTTFQFQELQNEYEKLFKNLLNGGSLNEEQKENEIVIDKAIRNIIDAIINIDGINIEVIGKWLWVGGNTYPVYQILKSSGLTFIKKAGIPYWVYKGVESSSRGKMSMEDIKNKYQVTKFDNISYKKLSGIYKINKTKLKINLTKLLKALDKRPI